MQFSGDVNTGIVGNPIAQIPIINPVDPYWFLNVLGTPVDSGPSCFDTVPAGFDANAKYYPGLSKNYLGATYTETPVHRQIQFATQDIPSIQLTIRRGISPDVLARWQLAQIEAADPRSFSNA